MKRFGGHPLGALALALAILGLSLFALATGAFGIAPRLQGALFDRFERAAPRAYDASAKIVVLRPDAEALARYGAWPWPHGTLAAIVTRLREQGAARLAFAFPLDAPQADAADFWRGLADTPQTVAARAAIAALPAPETVLADSLAGLPAVTGFLLRDDPDAPPASGALSGRDPFGRARNFNAAAMVPPVLRAASAGSGALNLMPDADNVVRRAPLMLRLNRQAVPSIDTAMLGFMLGAPRFESALGDLNLLTGTWGTVALDAGGRRIPLAFDAGAWIAFAGPRAERVTSVSQVMQGAADIRGANIVFEPPGTRVTTPLGVESVGEVHAEALETLVSGRALNRPAGIWLAEGAVLVLAALLMLSLMARAGVAAAFAFGAVCVGAALYGSWLAFQNARLLVDAGAPSAALAAVFLAGALAHAARHAAARAGARLAFSGVLAPASLGRIARDPALLRLEGETRTVTYLACGVRGLAAVTGNMADDPAAFTRLLQRTIAPLMDEVLARRGTIDRLTPDGFTAFWNAPLDDDDHAAHACEAAYAMTVTLAQINEAGQRERRLDGEAIAPVEVGIGISTGRAIAGGFSSHGRLSYSVQGDCTQVAAHIQHLSTQYGPAVIVSGDTRAAVERAYAFLEVDRIHVPERPEPVTLYAMLGTPVTRASPKFRALDTFHQQIFQSIRARKWAEARALIAQCRQLSGATQKLYDLHLARIAHFEANPPPEDWDGAFRPSVR